MPIPFILLLLLISILVWRRRSMAKYLVSCAFFVLLFLSSQLGVNTLVRPLESAYPINSTPIAGACFVMVLGSAHSDIQGATAVQSLSAVALARLSEGVRQLNLGQECKLIVSGWGGELTQVSHAEMMANAVVELGVDKRRIIQFPLARDTIEEAQYLQWELGEEPFRLVTSATHMPRAMAIFTAKGLHPEAAPTDFIGRDDFWWRLTADNLVASQRAIHEYIGRLWLWLKTVS
ncbi:YdcF family protein [Shewanella baltica]|uniref:YdcF family protein n=1 Tax=Shewanella baltica TaxID=62322 RepID=UPI00217E906A|nr:ElyC/SanA/YdcF family protein [Shewanella baltica]MCS6235974.1 YdcF family protein [Shewanella baltica]MCS6259692.1 YdcF family protein [Shewanella baltica]MCS6270469.1 YdcF family protein [Shewanella baltica]